MSRRSASFLSISVLSETKNFIINLWHDILMSDRGLLYRWLSTEPWRRETLWQHFHLQRRSEGRRGRVPRRLHTQSIPVVLRLPRRDWSLVWVSVYVSGVEACFYWHSSWWDFTWVPVCVSLIHLRVWYWMDHLISECHTRWLPRLSST